MGQGTCQSIEDGFALARLQDGARAARLPERLDRTRRVLNMARANRRVLRATDSDAQREFPSSTDVDDRPWLYAYDAEAEAEAVVRARS